MLAGRFRSGKEPVTQQTKCFPPKADTAACVKQPSTFLFAGGEHSLETAGHAFVPSIPLRSLFDITWGSHRVEISLLGERDIFCASKSPGDTFFWLLSDGAKRGGSLDSSSVWEQIGHVVTQRSQNEGVSPQS